jgi:hypothetical protein
VTPSTNPPARRDVRDLQPVMVRSDIGVSNEIEDLRIRIADLECQLANRDARIAHLIKAGDANGIDHTRPKWKQRWAEWMRAKGY